MRRLLVLSFLCAVIATLFPASGAASAGPITRLDADGNKIFDDLDRRIRGESSNARVEVVALFSEGRSSAEVAEAKRAIGPFKVIREYDLLSGVAAEMTVGQVRALAARPDTLQVQHNSRVDFQMDTARASYGVEKAITDFGHDGNNESGACPGVRNYCKDDVVVAVIDGGADYTHPDLDGGKVIGGINCSTGVCDPIYSYFDASGHGTASSGVIAGEGDVSPQHRGVAPGAGLVAVKVGSSGTTVSALDAALEWVIANRTVYGIEVVNMSLSGGSASDGTESSSRLTNRAAAAGILPVSAAGNGGPDPGTVGFPGSAKYSLTVGGMSEPRDSEGSFPPGFSLYMGSSRGPTADGRIKPDVLGPATDVTTTYPGGGYRLTGGTSLASPFVAGVAALALDGNPSLVPSGTACATGDTTIECADGVIDSSMDMRLKDAITSTAVDWGATGPDNEYGYGRVDAHAVIARVTGQTGSGSPSNPAHSFFSGTLGAGAVAEHAMSVSRLDFPVAATMIIVGRAKDATTPDFNLELVDPLGNVVATGRTEYNLRQEEVGFVPTTTGTYKVRIRAISGSGAYWADVSYPGDQGAPAPPPVLPPAAPGALTARTVSSTQIDLSWGDVADESGYRVQRSPNGVDSWTQIGSVGAGVTTFSNSGLSPSTTYHYRVVAYNSAGDSVPSNVASATTAADTTAPTTPTNLKATSGKLKVSLTWTGSTDSGGSGLAGYKVYRATTSTGTYTQIATTTTTSYTDTAVSKGKTYWYYVNAYDRANNHSAASNKVSGKPT
ncbi:MAG: S8 family serine peptidase [Actinomycetota bacterium]|nr:S8 family serine peptidase [Actinomycetota bacterium]